MLQAQLQKDPDCMGRITAVLELKKAPERSSVEALSRALAADPFWGVQAEAASALGEMRLETAREALAAALEKGVNHPKARRAVVKALGSYRDPAAAALLRKFAEKDPSYFVEAEACVALAQTAREPAQARELFGFLKSKAETPSWRATVRAGALRAMGELVGMSRGELPEVLEYVIGASRVGTPLDGRVASITVMGQTARMAVPSVRGRLMEVFSELCDEEHFRIRMALVAALASTGMPEAIGLLSRVRAIDTDGRVRRHALEASQILSEAGSVPEVVGTLRQALEKLEEEHRRLRADFERKNP
jgi:aminopeptidase N